MSTWKLKNKQSLNEIIKKNEQEIERLNRYMESFFSTEDETHKMQTAIHALESENVRLGKIVPTSLSPSEVINLTRPALPVQEGHSRKKVGSLVKISFTDSTAPESYRERQAIWKLVPSGWQYDRCE